MIFLWTHKNDWFLFVFYRVAVDQIDSLRRLLLNKDEELKQLHKQFEYQEIEKIKIVKKLAQVEEELDIKSHELRNIKSQLGDKEDTLEVSDMKHSGLDSFGPFTAAIILSF